MLIVRRRHAYCWHLGGEAPAGFWIGKSELALSARERQQAACGKHIMQRCLSAAGSPPPFPLPPSAEELNLGSKRSGKPSV